MGEVEVFGVALEGIIAVGVILIALLFLLWMVLWVRVGRLKKRLNALLRDTGVTDLESVLNRLHTQADSLISVTKDQSGRIATLERKTEEASGLVGIVRYNAFGDRGSDLSFSLALVNERSDGVVLSALHTRDESRVYAKPLEAGASAYSLTPEEKEAIIQAKRKS
ncbi:DUF4446 family protein [Paenibacillus sp. TRM 82003]|nr:DUF4446 family protein [Paenibacillus sp. TRM 82003]